MIVTARTVRETVENSLKTHLPTVLATVAAAHTLYGDDTYGLGLYGGAEILPPPKSWRRMADFTSLTEQDSPALVVTSGGIDGVPETQEDGGHRATWAIRVFIVARGRTYEETADRVADYTAAVRVALLTDPSLGGIAEQIIWRGESYTELDRDQQRTIAAGSVTVSYTLRTDLGDTSIPIVEATGTYGLLPVHPAL